MELDIDSKGVIVFKGNLTVSNIETVHSSLELLMEDSSQDINIDLSRVEEMDISGLQLLYSLKKTVEGEGSLRIRAVNPAIQEILDLSGFSLALKEALS
jgi:anti-anti-sigma factor